MWIAGYGSLMKYQFGSRLVIIRGWKRIFNKVAGRRTWKQHASGKNIAALNAMNSPGSSFNAVAFPVTDEGFQQLVEREQDYHAEKTVMYDIETGERVGSCVLFISNEKNKNSEIIVRDDIFPVPEYLQFCRKAAYSWGDDFGKTFDRTAFLADGTTSIEEFLKDQGASSETGVSW